jgi:hypothetical protein
MKKFIQSKRVFFLILFGVIPVSFHAQNLRQVLERRWYGHGTTKTDIIEGGTLVTLYELYDVELNDDLTVKAKLKETFILEGKSYRRYSEMQGKILSEQNKLELRDVRVNSQDLLPYQFQWDNNSFSLMIGRDAQRESGFGMKGTGYSGSSYLDEVLFLDYLYR